MYTEFQKAVWATIAKIPKGKITTYSEIAKHLKTNAVRAVGTAVGKNPYAPKVPCHRVIRSNGEVGNYSGKNGIQGKIKLLEKEGIKMEHNKIIDFQKCLWIPTS